MTKVNATFNVEEFENYGTINPYLSEQQLEQVLTTTDRVSGQLDWVGQLLGWSGDGYWDGLVNFVSQKRRMLGGSFGVYNGYIYPELVEIRNWSNSVVVKADPRILPGLPLYLGDSSYVPRELTQEGNNYILTFGELPPSFFTSLESGEQIRVISSVAIPEPFYRPNPGTSGDASFLCKEEENNSLVLYPSYNSPFSLPYKYNSLIAGCRYFFDKPVLLHLSENPPLVIKPQYNFSTESWYIDVPAISVNNDVGLSAVLTLGSSSLEVSIHNWENPSDWVNKNTIDNFRGVWNNKGGKLPFHFCFDALEIHGFDEKKSVFLGEVERYIAFDDMLESVYLQKAEVSESGTVRGKGSQVWWNNQTGAFSIFSGDPLNCGPWVEIDYPQGPQSQPIPDYVFSDVESLLTFTGDVSPGCLVRILDIAGLGSPLDIKGITETLIGPGSIDMLKDETGLFWEPYEITFQTVSDFSDNAQFLPPKVKVNIANSAGLEPSSTNYDINNLKFVITEEFPLVLMKSDNQSPWYIKPPSNLKYIGNTRLFESSLDYNNPVDGEMNWDFTNPNYNDRSARIFYYNRWVQDPIEGDWVLEGDWVEVNNGTPLSTVPQVVDFTTVLVYCNNVLLTEGVSYRTENFQFSYDINPLTGLFKFHYIPITYQGALDFPAVTISDSLTSAFQANITNLVFSGLTYYMSPNVMDSETLLRIWKSESLSVVDSLSELELLRNPNPLRADINSGPSDFNWERYFIRLPPSYDRYGSVWQKVDQICKNFAYWGSSTNLESMDCPSEEKKPRIYEEVHLYRQRADIPTLLYSEPYLFSDVVFGYGNFSDYGNSVILPTYDTPYDDFEEGDVVPYEPLHNRKADVISPVGGGYGEWEGAYYRASPCSSLSGYLTNDLMSELVEPAAAPLWDASIYKLPPLCPSEDPSSKVDANHFKIGYAFFAADLSAAEDTIFDLSKN